MVFWNDLLSFCVQTTSRIITRPRNPLPKAGVEFLGKPSKSVSNTFERGIDAASKLSPSIVYGGPVFAKKRTLAWTRKALLTFPHPLKGNVDQILGKSFEAEPKKVPRVLTDSSKQ